MYCVHTSKPGTAAQVSKLRSQPGRTPVQLPAQPESITLDYNPPHLSHRDGPEMNGSNPSLKRLQGLYLAAAVLRLVLFFAFPGLPELVAGRVEVSTPVTSFKRCMPRLLLLGWPNDSVRADH